MSETKAELSRRLEEMEEEKREMEKREKESDMSRQDAEARAIALTEELSRERAGRGRPAGSFRGGETAGREAPGFHVGEGGFSPSWRGKSLRDWRKSKLRQEDRVIQQHCESGSCGVDVVQFKLGSSWSRENARRITERFPSPGAAVYALADSDTDVISVVTLKRIRVFLQDQLILQYHNNPSPAVCAGMWVSDWKSELQQTSNYFTDNANVLLSPIDRNIYLQRIDAENKAKWAREAAVCADEVARSEQQASLRATEQGRQEERQKRAVAASPAVVSARREKPLLASMTGPPSHAVPPQQHSPSKTPDISCQREAVRPIEEFVSRTDAVGAEVGGSDCGTSCGVDEQVSNSDGGDGMEAFAAVQGPSPATTIFPTGEAPSMTFFPTAKAASTISLQREEAPTSRTIGGDADGSCGDSSEEEAISYSYSSSGGGGSSSDGSIGGEDARLEMGRKLYRSFDIGEIQLLEEHGNIGNMRYSSTSNGDDVEDGVDNGSYDARSVGDKAAHRTTRKEIAWGVNLPFDRGRDFDA